MSSIAPCDLILYDGFPGVADAAAPMVSNGFDSTQAGQHDTAANLYQAGRKIQMFQDGTVGKGGSSVANRGYYTMVYGKLVDYTNAVDASIGKMVCLACGSIKGAGNLCLTQDVSGGQNATAGVGHAPMAVPCTSLALNEFGWFWCGGVCPNHDISQLDITGFLTDGNVIGGAPIQMDSDGTTVRPSFFCSTHAADYLAFPAGFALADDA
jgi:hypothetical protein